MGKNIEKNPMGRWNFREGSLNVGVWLTHCDLTRYLGHLVRVIRSHDSVSSSRYAVCSPIQGQQGFPSPRCHAGHVCSLQDFFRLPTSAPSGKYTAVSMACLNVWVRGATPSSRAEIQVFRILRAI